MHKYRVGCSNIGAAAAESICASAPWLTYLGVASDRPSAYVQLKQEILTGVLRPGAALNETDLAERYGVSRTPVREALMRLDHDRVVERQRRGYQVRVVSPEEILEIYEARSIIEGAAAAAAAERHTATDRVRISAANNRYQELDDTDPVARVQANVDFHASIWAASHNRAFADLLERLNLQFLRFPNTTLTYPGRWDKSKKEHQELTDAILRRQPTLASELARLHTDAAGNVRAQIWEDEISQGRGDSGHSLFTE